MAREEGNGKIQHFGKMSEQRPRSTSPSLAAYPHINYGMPPGWVMVKDISGAESMRATVAVPCKRSRKAQWNQGPRLRFPNFVMEIDHDR